MVKVRVPGIHDAPISQVGRPRPTAGITKALRVALQDGNFHGLDELVRMLLYYLPEEYAEFVYYQRGRAIENKRARDSVIHAGRRDIVSNMIGGRFNTENKVVRSETYYRLVSKSAVCQSCHQQFVHEKKKPPPRCPRCTNLQQKDNLSRSPQWSNR